MVIITSYKQIFQSIVLPKLHLVVTLCLALAANFKSESSVLLVRRSTYLERLWSLQKLAFRFVALKANYRPMAVKTVANIQLTWTGNDPRGCGSENFREYFVFTIGGLGRATGDRSKSLSLS